MNASRIATAQLMVANRLIEPLSEWALIDWSQRTALPELLGTRITKTTKNRLYDAAQAHVYKMLGIDWKAACPAVKAELKSAATL